MGNKRIIMSEFTNRVNDFKNKINYLKCKYNDLKISYDAKVLEELMNLENQEFDNLLDVLIDFKIILYRNVKLGKMNFRYRLWKLKLQGNNLILISENQYLNKKTEIIINLLSKEKSNYFWYRLKKRSDTMKLIFLDVDGVLNNTQNIKKYRLFLGGRGDF